MELLQKFTAAPLDFIWSYGLPFVLVLSVLVFVHEWGHYIIARLCGVRVETFSIGFGREIFGWTDKKGTRWKISWLPLGGYVQMFGDIDPASAKHEDGVKEGDKTRPFTADEKKVAFYTQPVGKRSAIVFAGPAINFLLAIFILTALYAIQGQPYTPPIVGSLVEGSAAEAAGLKPDDKIIEINGTKIVRFQQLPQMTAVNLNKEMEVTFLRSTGQNQWNEEPVTVTLTPKLVEVTDRFGFKHTTGRMGIVSVKDAFEMQPHTPVSALVAAMNETWEISTNTLRAIGQMISGTRSSDELGGILRIGAYAGEFAKEGIISLISFAALLSVNLGLINLLPIPMLDGGHLAFYAMEKMNGKPMGERAQEYLLRIGMAFLLGIMVFATWNDLVQLKIVDYVKGLIS